MGETMATWQEQLRQWLEALPLDAKNEAERMELGEGGGLGNRCNLTWTCAARPAVAGRLPGYGWAFDERTRRSTGWRRNEEICRVHSGGKSSPEFPLCWGAAVILSEAGCSLNGAWGGLGWLLTVPEGSSLDALMARAAEVRGRPLPAVGTVTAQGSRIPAWADEPARRRLGKKEF